MLMTSERRPVIRTMRGWAIDVLQEAGAIRECEEHGWMRETLRGWTGVDPLEAKGK